MKRIACLTLVLALTLPFLTGCMPPMPVVSQETPFSALACQVPGDAEQAYFLNLKPEGEAGQHWARIRRQLEANPIGQQVLAELLRPFRVEKYGLNELIPGPAVSGYWHNVEYVAVHINDGDEETAAQALLQRLWSDAMWTQEEYEGQMLYYGRSKDSWQTRERVAWTIHDGLLFLVSRHGDQETAEEVLTQLKTLVSLDQAHSLAALPAWRTLVNRLPEAPMGLMFFNVAEVARRNPPPSGSPVAALGRQIETLAFSAVPEEEGMRVEIAGTITLQQDALPHVEALFDLPTLDPAAWPELPANTALTLISYDASVLWPFLREMFNLEALEQATDVIGLDVEADLMGAEGPLVRDFALALTPPLPGQPVGQGLPAGQLLILARGVSQTHMAAVQAAMEGRGAVFGPGEVEGLALQTQAGTALTGYALSYGVDDDTLFFGSSPQIIGQAIAARDESDGLVTEDAFQSLLALPPEEPTLTFYLHSERWASLTKANMTDEQYQNSPEHQGLEVFEAIGLKLQLTSDGIEGVAYFFVPQ
jgi:hypothetical protein